MLNTTRDWTIPEGILQRSATTIVRNTILYAAEMITLGVHRAEQLVKEERKILKKILRPKRVDKK